MKKLLIVKDFGEMQGKELEFLINMMGQLDADRLGQIQEKTEEHSEAYLQYVERAPQELTK